MASINHTMLSFAVVLLVLSETGCATAATKLAGGPGKVYDGVQEDWKALGCGGPLALFAAIDLPFSIIADTIFIPLDLLMKKKKEPQFGCHP